jgi:hypothetical protein
MPLGKYRSHTDTEYDRIVNILAMAKGPRLEKLGESKYTQVMKPLLVPKVVKHAIIIGFDSEWNPKSGELISIQFAIVKNDNLHSRIYYVNELSTKGLFEYVLRFLNEAQVSLSGMPRVRIYLIAHFAQSEISKITDFLEEWKLRVYNKAMSAEASIGALEDLEYESELHQRGWTKRGKYGLKILDLYGYFPRGLDKVGELVNLPKVDLDASKIHLILKQNPELFEQYAKRDSEICAKAFVELRELFLGEFGIDILKYPTTASLAGAIFRSRFLKEPNMPYRIEYRISKRQKPSGEWTEKVSPVHVYNGGLDIRNMALRSYWGGRAECYARGFLQVDFEYYDIISIYPSASMLLPLPNKSTRWLRIESLKEALLLEGFCRVRFEFPSDCKYPCLPVMPVKPEKLFFPLKGESYCTLSELRTALKFGAEIQEIEGYGFKPTESERNHPVAEFMRFFLKLKESEPEGSLKREMWKLIMNSLIGKFHQTSPEYDENYMLSFMQKTGLESLSDPGLRKYLYKSPVVGPCWSPEWATLILGKARALMAELIAKGSLFCSTDSGLFPKGTNLECEALEQLRSVGSDFRKEYECDSALLGRSRLYALFKNGEIIKSARHGTIASEHVFAEIVKDNLKAGKDLELKAQKTHLATAKDMIKKGKKLGESEIWERLIKWGWDGKRELAQPNVDIWKEWSETEPLKEIPEFPVESKEPISRVKTREPKVPRIKLGRPRALDLEQIAEAKKLHEDGWSLRKIAKHFRVGVATIKRSLV